MRYLVFGATSGIGAAITEDALERGMGVSCLGRNQEQLEKLAERGAVTHRVDLGDPLERDELWKGLGRQQQTHVVYAAGLAVRATVDSMTPDGLRSMFEVNTLAPLELIHWAYALPAGSVVTLLSSNLARSPLPHTIGYSASKAALEAACRASASTLGKKGLRLNCIAPGPIDTPMLRGQFSDAAATEAGLAGLASQGPLGRVGEVSDVVRTLRYIEESTWLTGEVITIDGGYSCPS